MKRIVFLSLLLLAVLSSLADNTVSTVEQVTNAITLSEDVDFHISSSTPFTTTGSIDITNTDHAVVIFDCLKPSVALKQLGFITINGQKAVNNRNCQVKMYNVGAIIMPYASDIKPLTVFSEDNFEGESCNDFGLEHSGGYMNSLSAAKLNNRIRSFKLKRGYMVTFSIQPGGRGYSRCFIADNADLEVGVLPAVLKNKISSYRLFKWNDASKKGLASDTRAEAVSALNASWCYDWATGIDRSPDTECVPNHIYEDWPSSAACGSVTYSPHMKTNNEPGNSADDHPQTVKEVLANWENLMRTGMRLCSPSSHDGSLNWLREFMDSIDARGWRCDILDMHCYWPEGSFGNLQGWYNNYHRPIWISEFVWGASWNNNGAFASGVTEADNAVVMKRIFKNLNDWNYIERYAYWNSERDPSKIYKNGKLTEAGKYFAEMDPGIGFKSNLQYIPRSPRVGSPTGLTLSFNPNSSVSLLKWNDTNGELVDSMFVERKIGNGQWEIIARIPVSDTSSSYTYRDTMTVTGLYTYRIHTITFLRADKYSGEVYNNISGTEKADEYGDVQYGTLSASSTEGAYSYFSSSFEEQPAIVFGSVSNLNNQIALVEHVNRIFKQNQRYQFFTSSFEPLSLYDKTEFRSGTTEYSSYITAKQGTGKIGTLPYEAGILPDVMVNDTASYTFTQTFTTTPVVMATPIYSSSLYQLMWRVFDVTPQGFKVVLQRQKELDVQNKTKIRGDISFFAIEQGKTSDGLGKMFWVRDTIVSFPSGTTLKKVEYGDVLTNPIVMAQMQTFNTKVAAILRTRPNNPDADNTRLRFQMDNTDDSFVITSKNPAEECIGLILISDDSNIEDAIRGVKVEKGNGKIAVYPSVVHDIMEVYDDDASAVNVYSLNGQRLITSSLTRGQTTLNVTALPAGIYIVRTNAGNSLKIIKK